MNVLLFYYYNVLDDPQSCHDEQCSFLSSKNIKGRIIISQEGINGTISGNIKDCEDYMNFLQNNEQFKNIAFKIAVNHRPQTVSGISKYPIPGALNVITVVI